MPTILEDTELFLNVFLAIVAVLCCAGMLTCMEKGGGLCALYISCCSKRLLGCAVCHHYLLCCTLVILGLLAWSGHLDMCSSRIDSVSFYHSVTTPWLLPTSSHSVSVIHLVAGVVGMSFLLHSVDVMLRSSMSNWHCVNHPRWVGIAQSV